MPPTLAIVQYCAEEVERQQDQPTAVFWMVRAWCQAMDERQRGMVLSLDQIKAWGRLVEPHENQHGFRRVAVRVGRRLCPDWQDLARLLDDWLGRVRGERRKAMDGQARPLPLSPELAYFEFELIHPFYDGNGRTGKILLNYLADTLETPIMPPNFFECANP